MAAKLIVLLALAAVAHCSVPGSFDHAAVAEPVREDVTSFSYDVADPYTGDFKSQSETRVGGTVQGQYSLLDADGTRRTVDYAADDLNGFNAVVRKDAVGVAAPVVAAKVVAPTVARTVAAPFIAAPNVINGGAVITDRTFAGPSVYAASAPLVSRTLINGGFVGARTVAANTVLNTGLGDTARLVDTRTFTAPTALNSGLLSRITAPTVLTGGARFIDTRTLAAPTAYNTGILSRTVAAPSVYNSGILSRAADAPFVTRTFGNTGVYAASAPLVTGGYTTGHDLFGTRTLTSPLVTGGVVRADGRLISPFNTFSGRIVTGHDVVRADW